MAKTGDENNKIICSRRPTDTLESDQAHCRASGFTNAPQQIPSDTNVDHASSDPVIEKSPTHGDCQIPSDTNVDHASSDPVIKKSPTHGDCLDERDELKPPDITNNRKFDKTFDVKLRTQQNTEQ